MSKVKKLSIRGIRNFSDDYEAIIKFDTPITLITGQNGVGKTTIIECLRYITTGDFPPNSDRGKFFIHDPLVKKQASVRACVKAQFADREGKSITLRRTLELSRFEKSVKLKSLDNTITVYNPVTNENNQLTNRCSNIDTETSNCLGVSKAILNHVIFCHQDDANWPLEEGKVIKDRFDAILDTTSYIKALEALRKFAKTRETQRRFMDVEKSKLSERVAHVEAQEQKLEELRVRKADIGEKINYMKAKLVPIEKRLVEIEGIEAEVRQLRMENEKEIVEYNLAQKQCESLSAAVKDIFDGTDEQLTKTIASYDITLHDKNKRISIIRQELQQVSENEHQLSKLLGENKVKLGTLNQQMQDHDKKLQQRNQVLSAALKLWNLEVIENFDSVNDVQKAIELVEKKTQQLERLLSTKRMKHDEEERLLEKKVEDAREKRSNINSELKRSEKEMEHLRSTIRNIKITISQSNNDDLDTKLTIIEEKISEWEGKMNQVCQLIEKENLDQKMSLESEKLEELDGSLARLDDDISIIQSQSAMNHKLESLKANCKSKNEEIDKLKEKHEANLKKLLGKNRLPDCDLKASIEEVQKVLSDRLHILTREYKTKEYELIELEAATQQAKKDLELKVANNEQNKDKVKIHCKNYKNYNDTLLHQQTKVKSLQNKRGMIAHQGVAYNEYIKELKKNSCCALCERTFSSTAEAKNLSRKLEKGIADNPDVLKQCERELDAEQRKCDALLSMKNLVENIIVFEKNEKEQLVKNIAGKEKEIEEAKKKLSELKELTSEPEKKIDMIKAIIPDLSIWDHYSEDLMQNAIALDELQEKILSLGGTTNKTMDQIQAEREVLRKDIKDSRDNINKMRSNLDARKEELRQATEKRTKYLEEQLKLHERHRDLARMKDELKSLLDKDSKVKYSVSELRKELMVVKEECDKVTEELDELKSNNRMEQEADRKKAKEFERQWETLKGLQAEISNFYAKHIDKELDKLQDEVKRHTKTCEEKRKERMTKEKELMEIKEDISCHETKKRNLSDNIELRKFQKTLKTLEFSRRHRKSRMDSLNYDQIHQEKLKLIEEQKTAENDIHKATGSKQEIKTSIRELTAELKSPETQSARSDYRAKCLAIIVTAQAIKDALSYAEILDKATAEYHQERLTQINIAMKKLWRLIYSGSDTESIEIRAEATSTTGKTDRRQFNYKLVQVKHGAEMDMRGRCSAGQRVLASIILRLALAETLSDHTGILALDEPTTNLDGDNSAKLAETLYKYVAMRAKYDKNFQLIIITHDDNFISRLSELNNHRWRQELYRNEDGLTKVRRMELQTDTQISGRDSDDDGADNETQQNETSSNKRAHSGDGSPRRSKKPYCFDVNFD